LIGITKLTGWWKQRSKFLDQELLESFAEKKNIDQSGWWKQRSKFLDQELLESFAEKKNIDQSGCQAVSVAAPTDSPPFRWVLETRLGADSQRIKTPQLSPENL